MIPYLYQTNHLRSSPQVVFGDVQYPPGGLFGPRTQQDVQLVVVDIGEAHVTIDEDELLLPAQHAALLLPGKREFFRFAPAHQTRHRWCAVAPHAVPETLRARLAGVPLCQPLSARVNELLALGLSIPNGDFDNANELLVGIGIALLHAYLFDAEYMRVRSRTPPAVFRAQQFIDARLSEPLNVAEIAAAAGVTPQHISRLFQRHLHTTPARYLWKRRTERGVELLRETGLSVSEVAERVGFESPFHFTRLARQHYGFSPRQLRQRLRNG